MKKTLSILAVLAACSTLAAAQPLRGSYFLENSLLRGQLNPAFAPKSHYVSVPVAGYAGIEILSNIGLENLIFPVDGTSYTFLNDAVDADTFLKRLPEEDSYVRYRMETNLLNGGYRVHDKLYLTAGLSVVQWGDIRVSNELLRFAKTGRNGSENWSIQDGGDLRLARFAVLSASASYDLNDLVPGLRAGGRLKLMTGIKAASGQLDNAEFQLHEDLFAASVRGNALLAGYAYDPEEGFLSGHFGLRGFGASVDLGAEYRIRLDGFFNRLNLSASVCGLGGFSFGKVDRLTASGSASFSGFQDFGEDGFDLQEGLQTVIDDFSGLADFNRNGQEKFPYPLSPDIFAGAEVTMFQDLLGVGLLYNRSLGMDNLTASVNLAPLRWLDFSVDVTFLGAGTRFGLFAECTPCKYIDFFFGFQKASWRTNRQMLGVRSLTESFSAGINVLL